MATITGNFSGVGSGNAYPLISWSSSESIAGNYSDVTATLYFHRSSSYYSYNLNNNANNTSNVDGNTTTANSNFDTRPGIGDYSIRTVTQRVFHNADGSRNAYVGWSGNTQTGYGTYNFGQTVTLPQIPRAAYITNDPSFTITNTIPLAINNPGSLYLKAYLYVNSTLIKTVTLGQVSSYTISTNSTDNNNMYAQMPNVTSITMLMRIVTFSDAAYTVQVGSNQDAAGTCYIQGYLNVPVFTTYTVANIDKSIVVQDSYSNTLTTSSTATLLGSSSKMINGFSKLRATISIVNQAVPVNYATMVKYRFVDDIQQTEATFSNSANVTIDIDNATNIATSVTAYDSRNETTQVSLSMSLIANYFPVTIYNALLTRDNGVDGPTKLSFSGNVYPYYFGSGSATSSGVLNTLTTHYRYKLTTDTWGAQTWNSITATVDGTGNISFNTYVNGDLGASGFTTSSAFDIQVRGFDMLTAIIVGGSLNKGIPLIDQTKNGIAIKGVYNSSDDSVFQINGSETIRQVSSTPSSPTDSTTLKMYLKSNKLIVQYNDSGTLRYKYLDLTGTTVTWIATTTAP